MSRNVRFWESHFLKKSQDLPSDGSTQALYKQLRRDDIRYTRIDWYSQHELL